VRGAQIARKLAAALRCYRGDKRVAVGVVPIGGAGGHARRLANAAKDPCHPYAEFAGKVRSPETCFGDSAKARHDVETRCGGRPRPLPPCSQVNRSGTRLGAAWPKVLQQSGLTLGSPERRALAQRLGADVVVDPRETSPFEALITAAATDDPARMAAPTAVLGQLPLRPTVAFECVGVPGLLQQLIGGVLAGSRIAVAGINMGSDSFEPAQGILKELDIRFSLYYTPQEFAQTFTHLAAGELDAAALLTGTVGLDGVADAFERLGNSPSEAKILLDPSR
jgi:hypothetical protein